MLSCGVTMNDLDILRALLKEEVLAPASDTQTNQKNLLLTEPRGQSYELRIIRAPYDTIAFRADAFPSPRHIFRGSKGERKRADYVIIANEDDRSWIVYVEMKAGNDGLASEIAAQLRGAHCLVAYCRAIGRQFWGESAFLEAGSYREHFVSVKGVGSNKKPSWPSPRPRNDSPETMWKFRSPPRGTLRFRELVEGRHSQA